MGYELMTSENGNLNRKGKSDVCFVSYSLLKAMKSIIKSFLLARNRYLEVLVKFARVAFTALFRDGIGELGTWKSWKTELGVSSVLCDLN